MGRSLLVLVLTVCISATCVAADRSWSVASSAHFTVISDDGPKTARDVLWQFEQVRPAIRTYWSWAQTDLDRPVLILTARDEERMKTLAPKYWEQRGSIHPSSVSVSGVDRYYVALRSDVKADDRQGSVNPYLDAYWSYTSLVMGNGLRRELPLWFARGLAGFMSNTIVHGSSLDVGRIVPWYLQTLQAGVRPTLRELLTADRTSPWNTNEIKLRQFDAEAWVFVHYLMIGDNGAHRAQLDQFAALVREGKTAAGAMESVFGNVDALETAFKIYYSKPLFQYMVFSVDAKVRQDAFDAHPLAPAGAAASLAAWHAAMGRPLEARTAIGDAKKADARLAAAFDAEGILLDGERKTDEARTAYATAIELQSTNAFVHYRWASLSWSPQTDVATKTHIDQALDRATMLNDRLAPAFALSAFVKSQFGHADQALPLAVRAVTLAPEEAQYRLTLASVLLMLSRRDEARVQASTAFELATTDAGRRTAQQIIEVITRGSAPARGQDGK